MTRWHKASCSSPDISLWEDRWPYCIACDSVCPSLAELCARQAEAGASSLTIPPDERQGQMHLYWPPCVRYVHDDIQHSSSLRDDRAWPNASASTKRTPNPPVTSDFIYGSTLDGTEFRIACLSPPENEGDPAHVNLETYSDDSHPEYETVSYVWSGEDGNNSPSHPIFIGLHWGVLLQTENCWHMLRSIRPERGQRLVWVDALCINQQNLQERASQVAKMRRIYEHCSRVIAYLGNDVVTRSKPFPGYRPLYELHEANTNHKLFPEDHRYHKTFFGLKEMLSRKYFTRVWIVQELLLPERVIFRIGDTEFRADVSIMSRITNHHLKSPAWWSGTAAPWVQHLGQKRLLDQKTFCDTFAVLRFARSSHASDPRDRFFGIVALMHDERLKAQFTPDYSISYQHLCIGLFAHWILNRQAYSLLYKARTLLRTTNSAPTWLPECNSGAWNKILDSDLDRWLYHCACEFQAFVSNGRSSNDRYLLALRGILKHEPEASRICALASVRSGNWGSLWHENSYVNASTGALALNLIHLFRFDKRPRLVQMDQESDHIYVVDESESDRLYMTSQLRLDEIVQPGLDHMFLISGAERTLSGVDYNEHTGNRILYLILRPTADVTGSSPRFRLLTAETFLLEVMHTDDPNVWRWDRCETISHSCLLPFLPEGNNLNDKSSPVDPTHSVAKTITSVAEDLAWHAWGMELIKNWYKTKRDDWDNEDRDWKQQRIWQQIFPNISDRTYMANAVLALCQAMRFPGSAARRTELLQAVTRLNRTEEAGGYLVIDIHRRDWSQRIRKYYELYLEIDWLLMQGKSQIWEDAMRSACGPNPNSIRGLFRSIRAERSQTPDDSEFHMCAPTERIVNRLVIELGSIVRSLNSIMESYDPPLDMEAAWNMIRDGPTKEQRYIGSPKIFGGVTMDGSMYQVEIL